MAATGEAQANRFPCMQVTETVKKEYAGTIHVENHKETQILRDAKVQTLVSKQSCLRRELEWTNKCLKPPTILLH